MGGTGGGVGGGGGTIAASVVRRPASANRYSPIRLAAQVHLIQNLHILGYYSLEPRQAKLLKHARI